MPSCLLMLLTAGDAMLDSVASMPRLTPTHMQSCFCTAQSALGVKYLTVLAGADPSGAARRPNQAHSKDTATSSSPDLPRPSLASEAPGDTLSGPALHMIVHSASGHCGIVSRTSAAPGTMKAFGTARHAACQPVSPAMAW